MTEYPNVADEHGPVIVTRDGARISPVLPCANDGFHFVLRHQGQSVSYALTHAGYAIESVHAAPWEKEEAQRHASMARNVMYGDPSHNAWEYHSGPGSVLTRENCGPCVLHGYHDVQDWRENGKVGPLMPNYAGWARIYVESQTAVPAKYRNGLIAELNSDNDAYARALARDLATWGVRYTD